MKTRIVIAAACSLMLTNFTQAAEIKVLASGAVKEAYRELLPQFESASGHKAAVTWAGTVDIKKRMAAGELFDLVIVAAPEVEAFVTQGKIVPGSRVDLVKSRVGVAVKAGARKPDISSGDALKKTLLAAKSVGFSTGPSGVYIKSLFEKLGIADEIAAKAKVTPPGMGVAKIIATGEAEIGFQQVSELIHEPGIDFLGPLPAELNNVTLFSSGIHSGSTQASGAKALQTFLSAPAAAPIVRKHGLEPG